MTQSKQQLSETMRASILTRKEAVARTATGQSASSDVDPRITYPCYKSFDEFLDVERLKSLDAYITERIRRHIQAQSDLRFYTGPYRFDDTAPDRPGSRMIYLAQSSQPDSYFDLDKTELWKPTEATSEFSLLMDFIDTLPFKATGRMLIMYDDVQRPVPAHRDHVETELCHDFIWFRTNLKKPFYMLNHRTGEKRYVESYSAWFDSVNQFHGSDVSEGLSFSIRVDGHFTDAFKKRIPVPAYNLASTPALWACLSV
ncbi:MAG: hypothetical protein ICV60_21895 [Pyrinomonadaceae bacterium]|nr:hypothetical protein [Pyrinomonadaceae bacterium]